MPDEKQIHPFINYLYSLADGSRRGALADLRRGLSEPPGTAPEMFPYVTRWIPEEARSTWKESVYYLVAGLFAYYQSGSGTVGKQKLTAGNLGDHCRRAAQEKQCSDSFEKRFTALLNANTEDLPVLLRQMVSLLKSSDVPINWNRLFKDLQYWNTESRFVQRQWANGFWSYQSNSNDNSPSE